MKNGFTKVLVIVFIVCSTAVLGQALKGKIVDANSGESLAYVSIGVIGTTLGTVSNMQGEFSLNIANKSIEQTVRFSMIGYHSKEYLASELIGVSVKIEFEESSVELEMVTVKPNQFKRKHLGTKSEAKNIVTGWGGFGKGGERGLKLKIEKETYLEYLHFHIASTSYDSILLRLHIRSLINKIPAEELLTQEIRIPVSIKTGWVDVDLEKYNLVFNKNIVLTLEWVDAWGKTDGVLCFSWNMFSGHLFAKEASEAFWTETKGSPGIYLDILESK